MVRGAVSEVEDYARVSIRPMADLAIVGRAVGDVIHLLAELLENATSFSPPHTRVNVGGEVVAHGFAIEIEDRGLGMSPEALDACNHRLAEPPDFDPANSAQLGLFVVARLAARHGVRVQLRSSAYGGVTAVALLPADLIAQDGDGPRELLAAVADDVVGNGRPRYREIATAARPAIAAPPAAGTSSSDLPSRATTAPAQRQPDLPPRPVITDLPRPVPPDLPNRTSDVQGRTNDLPSRTASVTELTPRPRTAPDLTRYAAPAFAGRGDRTGQQRRVAPPGPADQPRATAARAGADRMTGTRQSRPRHAHPSSCGR